MTQVSVRDRCGRWWWLLLVLLVVVAAALTILMVRNQSVPEADAGFPIQIQSTDWRVGEGVELIIQTQPLIASRAISLTVLAPGQGQPRIEGLPPEFFGLSGVQILWLPEEYREPEMLLATAAGARIIGLDFDWQRIEPEPGRYVWDGTDDAVALAKRYGLRLVPMLLFTPYWASTAPFAPLNYQHAPPADYADYRDFVYAVVNRYKPYGNSKLTADGYGITDWVIWNEPNTRSRKEAPAPGDFWTGSIEEYLLLLRAGYEGAHAADPTCNVLNGALADIFWAEGEQDLTTALVRMYDPNGDGDAGDGARPFFDTLNIHTYQLGPPDAAWYEERLSAVVDVMSRFGDERKPIWITETGYGSVPTPVADSPYVSEEAQAEAIQLVYGVCSSFPQVKRVFWWSLRDYYSNASDLNRAMEAHYGLVRASFDPKPAYLSYGQMTGRVGQVLNLAGITDSTGTARFEIPGTSVTEAGMYVIFASLKGTTPTVVNAYNTATGEGQ
jgi:hypothetical protein